MKKIFIAFFVLLGVSITQTYGQIPAGAKLVKSIDFGSGTTTPSPVGTAPTILASLGVETKFTPFAWTNTAGNSLPADNYMLVQTINSSSWAYRVWWGYSTTGNGVTATQANNSFKDHTGNTGGYFMVTNTDIDTVSYIMRFTIGNLCPNSNLYLSVYLGNLVISTAGTSGGPGTSGTTYYDPKLRFAIVDARSIDANALNPLTPVDTIYRNSMPTEVPKNTPAQLPQWTQYGFTFSNKTDSIVLLVYNNQPQSTGNDLAIDDVELYIIPVAITVSSISSPSFYYCEDQPMDMAGSYDDPFESFEGHAEFMWLYSQYEDFRDSTFVSADSVCRAPAKAGWYKVVVGAEGNTHPSNAGGPTYNNLCCSVSQPVEVKMIPPSTVLYWNPNAANQNWNDYRNWWLTPSGTTSSFPPSTCTDVHIPGKVNTVYPSLDAAASNACHYIWFHFGGLIGQPHLLQYDSAYVQYNFGKSNGSNGDTYSPATPMSRDRYYSLSAPLQRMVSGDFAFGGFPLTWQKSFKTSLNQTTGEINTGDINGDFFYPDSTNDWRIFTQYNAIVIYVDGDLTNEYVTGSYQNNLDKLNGILEAPYYDDAANLQYHRVEQAGNISSFPYFDYKSMNFLDADRSVYPPGTIDRGAGNAYRFIFQDPTLFTKTGNKYTMLNIRAGDILVGNPFMSNLDFNAFSEDNATYGIDSYSIYNGTSYDSYSYTAGSANPLRYIAPLQSFIINTGPATTLMFDADREAVAAPVTTAGKLRASVDDNTKPDVLYFKAESKAGVSYLTLSMQNVKKKNINLIWPRDWDGDRNVFVDAYPDAPRLYAADVAGQKNTIQFEGGYVDQVPLGILSSGSDQVTLTVYNKDKVSTDYLTLWDKVTDKKIDLKTTDTYTFTNVPAVQDRFVLMFSNKSITGISSVEAAHPVNVSAMDNTLYISAAIGIEAISVITLQGITVMKENNIGQTTCSKSLQVPPGLYIVSVKLKTGETSVAKVVIK